MSVSTYNYKTRGVCSREIHISVDENGIITDASYVGGCSGNTQGVAALVKGMSMDEAISRLSGIKCGFKNTSCPDQLAVALTMIKENKL